MNRRNFLAAMLAACAAPAIVRADSLMRIAVPRQELTLPKFGEKSMHFDGVGDYLEVDASTLEYSAKEAGGEWVNYAFVRNNGVMLAYVNGVLVNPATVTPHVEILSGETLIGTPKPGHFIGHIEDVRLTVGVARPADLLLHPPVTLAR